MMSTALPVGPRVERKPGEWASTPARRQRILAAALACFDAKGSAATTIDDICRKADLSVGSVYHQFDGKDAIFAELVHRATAEYLVGAVSALEGGKGLRSSVERLVRFHVRWVHQRRPLTRLMLQWEESVRGLPEGREHYRASSDALAGWLRSEARAGRIRRMVPDLYSALLMGPLMEYARQRAAGLVTAGPRAMESGLVDGLLRVLRP